MYWPAETEELLIICCLGSEDEKLYASSITKKILEEKYCSKQVTNPSKGSYSYAIKKLKKKGIIKETGEKVDTRGASGRVLKLTNRGREVFTEIWDLYPVLEYIAPFQKMIYECELCKEDVRERCFEVQRKDLDITLENHYHLQEGARKRIIKDISVLVDAPMSLGEFVFWLTMNKVAKERLNDKYDTYFQIVNSHVVDKVNVITK
jgi:DNA-binding PadR family transcriptional regulator